MDVWSFGCVLFEMLTGRRTFRGSGISDVLASVLKIDPDWNSLPLNIHPRILTLLERCLEKEVKDRYQAIGDARVDVRQALADPAGALVQPVAGVLQAHSQARLPWITAISLSLIIGVAVWNLKPVPIPDPGSVRRFAYDFPEGQQFGENGFAVLALAPDGRAFVYNTNEGLLLRTGEDLDGRLIPGTEEGLANPFFRRTDSPLDFGHGLINSSSESPLPEVCR